MFQKILVPLDGTALAEEIMPVVSHLARGLGLPVTVLSVVDPDSGRSPAGPGDDRAPREQGTVTPVGATGKTGTAEGAGSWEA